jgi:hypothetical protein
VHRPHYQLHLHSNSTKSQLESLQQGGDIARIPPLPIHVHIEKIYSDFLKYVYNHTRCYFERMESAGNALWERLKDRISVILTIPNGWDMHQQRILRSATISGGLVSEKYADIRLHFLSECESSVHFSIHGAASNHWPVPGMMFIVMDAGGSTVDGTLYKCTRVIPKLELVEVAGRQSECIQVRLNFTDCLYRPICLQAGGVFIDRGIQDLLKEKLAKSQFAEIIQLIMKEFEATVS